MRALRLLGLLCGAVALHALGGGSGLNTLVVINQSSSNSCALGNYYCERRQVPPDNVLFIAWNGGNTSWNSDQFQTNLLNPLLSRLATAQLTNQVDFVALSMDIPFQVTYGTTVNSTTAALFYGLKPDGGTNWNGVTNSYAASEGIFRQAKPASAPGCSFLATMLTADSLAQAKQMVDQGVAGDGTFPATPVLLQKTSDPIRNIRYTAFDNAIFNTRLRGNSALLRMEGDSLRAGARLLGLQTGLANFTLPPGTFAPGAMADNLSSYGGLVFGPNGQTTLLALIQAGAAGSYGTVTEPSPDLQKFPDPQNYFYQARGFTLAECYYQSLAAPYLGLVVGEPLSAPYAKTGSGKWSAPPNAILSGTAPLSIRFSASDPSRPLQQVDLFVDGKYFQTLTNLAPSPGNQLTVTLNGYPVSYVVPANATLGSVAADLAARFNDPATTNFTQVQALLHGDRIELRSLLTNAAAVPFYIPLAAGTGWSARACRVTYLPSPVPPQLAAQGLDEAGAFRLLLGNPEAAPCVIQASADLVTWLPLATNSSTGWTEFRDTTAPGYSRRFYRVLSAAPNPRPTLSLLSPGGHQPPQLHVDAQTALPYVLQASTNLGSWSSLATNLSGGPMDFTDARAVQSHCSFYRAWVLSPLMTNPTVTLVSSPSGESLFRVDAAVRPFTIEVSTNLNQWTSLATNFTHGQILAAVSATRGSAALLSTSLAASQAAFLDSPADGFQGFTANGIYQVGTWLQLNVVKTNGVSLSLAVTNRAGGGTILDLAQQLTNLVNATPELQGADGLVAEDLGTGLYGAAAFNLRARSPGYAAASVQAQLKGNSKLTTNPKTESLLNANLSDLQPRNHLYITAGTASLSVTFPLQTTLLPDGFHELTAVAYEGSHVRTQTRLTLPVQIRNSPLQATLAFLDMADTAPVQGTYHVAVTANTNSVQTIRLFTTGGLLGTSTNQSSATFTVKAQSLGAGLHRFYALVETVDGLRFRTAARPLRLTGL